MTAWRKRVVLAAVGADLLPLQVPHLAEHRAAGDVCALVLVLWRMLAERCARDDLADVVDACRLVAPRVDAEMS